MDGVLLLLVLLRPQTASLQQCAYQFSEGGPELLVSQ